MTHFYDDPSFSYDQYWQSRSYEHQSEVIAIKKLLGHHHFTQAADIGGGYGRLTSLLTQYAKRAILVEPAAKQRQLAKKMFEQSKFEIVSGTAEKTTLDDKSCDLVVMVRVMHHLPHPDAAFKELARITKPKGTLILEFANSLNFKSRLASWLSGKPILPTPLEKRSQVNIKRQSIPFVNHHPHYVKKLLNKYGFRVETVLSVSNFRHPLLKKIVPLPLLLGLESVGQMLLGKVYFGPSVFLLVQRIDK